MSKKLVAIASIFMVSVSSTLAAAAASPVDVVDPLIGTAIHRDSSLLGGGLGGNTLPGASYPFGMVLWSPETKRVDSGVFEYTQKELTGFSLTHLSGPGCAAAGEFPILPTLDPNAPTVAYSHKGEAASPGYYALTLDNGIALELTVTARTGFGVFRFPQGFGSGYLVLDASHTSLQTIKAHVERASDHEIFGWAEGGFFCGNKNKTLVNFVLQSDVPFQFADMGAGKARLTYPAGATAKIKVGLSYVSVAGARANLAGENPGWDFATVRATAREAWSQKLSVIDVETKDPSRLKVFYTALYHTLLHPNIMSDLPKPGATGGEYPGFDDKTVFEGYNGAIAQPKTAQGYTYYANFSGWDTYRSQAQLLAWLFPHEASDMMKSYTAAAEQCGAFPRWAEYNHETAVMVGDPAAGIVAGSYAFGAKDFPAAKALGFLINSGTNPNAACWPYASRPGMKEYLANGFIPITTQYVWGPVATGLEYAVADYAISRFARDLGDTASFNLFDQHSRWWKNNFDSTSGLPRPREADGSWRAAFDPMNGKNGGFVEGNAYQYLWFVPHDARALIEWIGGDDVAIRRLDEHFSKTNSGPDSPYFYIGNEPSFHTPWLYNYTNKPSRTQAQVRKIMDESFHTGTDGLPGNDDLGASSSWYVWSAIGLFPAVPGEAKLSLASPAFTRVTVRLPNGKTLNLRAPQAPATYIQSVRANAKTLERPWLPEAMIFSGGDVDYDLGTSAQDAGWKSPTAN